jgi:4a-hydroxytetrahydrobiopterin dehydratase
MGLESKRCVPCEGGVPKLGPIEIASLLPEVPGWREEGDRIHRTFQFPDFVRAMAFLNRVATIAEAEGHHPDFCVHYSKVEMTIWTHAIGGLSENDFILAAKIDRAVEA